MPDYILLSTTLVLACWAFYALYGFQPRLLRGIPYSALSATKFTGDLGKVVARAKLVNEHSAALFSLNRDQGSAIVQLLTFPWSKPVVLIDDPREAEDILKRRGREFDRSQMTIDFFHYLLPRCTMAQPTTASLKMQKRIWSDTMSHDFLVRSLGPKLEQKATAFIRLWQRKSKVTKEMTLDVERDFRKLTTEILWGVMFGHDIDIMGKELTSVTDGAEDAALNALEMSAATASDKSAGEAMLWRTLELADDTVIRLLGSVSTTLQLIWTKCSARYRSVKREMHIQLDRLIGSAHLRLHARYEQDASRVDDTVCALDLVLKRQEASKVAGLADKHNVLCDSALRDECMLLLLAGIDSTSHTLAWAVKLLTAHQAAQSRLRGTLRCAFPGHLDSNKPTASDIMSADIPHLDAFVHEVFRFAVTAGAIVRQATCATTILGCRIPAGTNVLINTRVLSQPLPVNEEMRSASSQAAHIARPRRGLVQNEAESPDLSCFEPSRWLTTNAESAEVFDPETLPTLIFGGGIRGCFGTYAKIRLLYPEVRF